MEVWTIIIVVLWLTCMIPAFVFYFANQEPRKSFDKTVSSTIKLPCNIGDAVWFDTYSGRGINEGLKPHEVLDFKVYAVVSSDRGYPCDIDISEFGKTVFLTKKGANTNEK